MSSYSRTKVCTQNTSSKKKFVKLNIVPVEYYQYTKPVIKLAAIIPVKNFK
jgi:hypothetical protein